MAIPTISTKFDKLAASTGKMAGWVARGYYLNESTFAEFWSGDVMANAQTLNEFATATNTTAAAIFTDHALVADLLTALNPSVDCSSPPIDMSQVFDSGGMIDLDQLASALGEEEG